MPRPAESLDLSASDVHVWHASLLVPDSLLSRLRGLLSPEERARAERFTIEEARVRFIAAHGVLRDVLSRYVNARPETLTFAEGPNGKPRLAEERGTGESVRFNLAHADDAALIAVARTREVGVDLERIRSGVEALGIAERFFAPGEFERLRRLPRDEARRWFFTLWTSKEAYVKARGVGLSSGLDRFEIELAPEATVARVRLLEPGREDENCVVRLLSLGPDYAGAVAAEGDDWRVTYRRWPDLEPAVAG